MSSAMKIVTRRRISLALMVAACLSVACLFVCEHSPVQGQSGLSPQELRGKRIFMRGESESGEEITAFLGGGDEGLPAASFTCSNCHGLKGEGQQEGGLQPPAINWNALTHAHTSALTRQRIPPYNDSTLARAISTSVDSAGARLHPGMPRYQMADAQMADLIAYLKKIGTAADADSGLNSETIKVGAALPLTGPLAEIGGDVKAAMNAVFTDINSQGGIYGREISLVVEDSRGEAKETTAATRRLIEQDNVFALVGSFEPGDGQATDELLKRTEVPLIGPGTLSPRLALPPNPYVFYLLPTFNDQAHALVNFAASKTVNQTPSLAVVYAQSEFDADALAGVRAQAKRRSMPIVAEQGFAATSFSPAAIVENLGRKKPSFIFFFGNSNQITAFAREMERAHLDATLLSSVLMVGRGAFSLSPKMAKRTFLSFPSALPGKEGFADFLDVMGREKVGLRNTAFQALGFAAAKTFIEALKLSNRELNRPSLVKALEQLRDFKTGVVPPLTFGPNRRVGATGSYVVGIDLDQKQYVPLGERYAAEAQP
jgi:ABC-type branched-subunit amino acid transport system substrate-binding protein